MTSTLVAEALKSAMIIFKTIIFMIVVPGTVLFYVPYEIVTSSFNVTFRLGILRFAAFVPWLSGILGLLWCFWDFTFKGKGTPAPIDPPKELVVEGLYKFVRNPMYVSIMLILSGHILWFQSIWLILYTVSLFVLFHLFIVFYEEPYLQKRFGDSYKYYFQKVSRWIPRAPR